ncbi:hypothetical protein ACFLS9_00635 [Bacteroidota bacterium]
MKHLLTSILIISILSSVIYSQDSSQVVLKKNSFGFGFGIPYGILGGNIDINVVPNLNLSAGIGSTILAGIGYSFGIKYFFMPIEQTFRLRVSAYYGTNAAIEYSGDSKDNESFAGLNLGVGFQMMWGETKSNGLDFDIIYIATTGLDAKEEGVEEPVKVKISLGYRHGF